MFKLIEFGRFRAYKLKIDQSFVRGLDGDPEDQAIVKAIINLADSLGMDTVAEGVETAAQAAVLQAHGCRKAQGFHFSHPLPADEFAALARQPVPEARLLQALPPPDRSGFASRK